MIKKFKLLILFISYLILRRVIANENSYLKRYEHLTPSNFDYLLVSGESDSQGNTEIPAIVANKKQAIETDGDLEVFKEKSENVHKNSDELHSISIHLTPSSNFDQLLVNGGGESEKIAEISVADAVITTKKEQASETDNASDTIKQEMDNAYKNIDQLRSLSLLYRFDTAGSHTKSHKPYDLYYYRTNIDYNQNKRVNEKSRHKQPEVSKYTVIQNEAENNNIYYKDDDEPIKKEDHDNILPYEESRKQTFPYSLPFNGEKYAQNRPNAYEHVDNYNEKHDRENIKKYSEKKQYKIRGKTKKVKGNNYNNNNAGVSIAGRKVAFNNNNAADDDQPDQFNNDNTNSNINFNNNNAGEHVGHNYNNNNAGVSTVDANFNNNNEPNTNNNYNNNNAGVALGDKFKSRFGKIYSAQNNNKVPDV